MMRFSGRCRLGVGALALAYPLVLQLLLASVFAGRAVGDPLSPSARAICLNGAASAGEGGDGKSGPAIVHCPLCTLRVDATLPPLLVAGEVVNPPAFAVVWAGGISSLPAVNGMSADQVQVSIDGMLFGPACPNIINPPLSYVNPAMIGQVKVYSGTAPVSVGGDYTGGRIDVTVASPTFTDNRARPQDALAQSL